MINDYFDRIFCVNLDRRFDKWEICEKEFTKLGLTVERFPAIDGRLVPYNGRLPIGAVGNAMSHAQILRVAKENHWERVLILEDDVVFDNELQKKFMEWRKQVPDDWDLLYFGGNHNLTGNSNIDKEIITQVSTNLLRITNTYTTHAYAVNKSVYDIIIDRLETLSTEGDVIMADIQKTHKAFCFTPSLAWQRSGISDVFNIYVDYAFLKPK